MAPREKYGSVVAYWVHDRFLLGAGFGIGFGRSDETPVTMTALVEPMIGGIQAQYNRIESDL